MINNNICLIYIKTNLIKNNIIKRGKNNFNNYYINYKDGINQDEYFIY